MPATPITTSPDISSLDFSILYDISGPIPAITLTNASVGVPSGTTRLNLCTWWYVITTPSGTVIHEGSETTPDVPGANWTILSIAPYSWPTIFGNPPCGQVEFSCSVPYITTLYVKDSANNIFSLSKVTTICRPNGSVSATCGSFGVSNVGVQVKCNSATIYCSDTTNYAYQSQLSPAVQTNAWTLVYPLDTNGNQPTNKTAANTPYVNFPVGYSGDGYKVYLSTYGTYSMGDGVTIKIQYKGTNSFAVLCNIDFCKLQCKIQKYYELSRKSCGTLEDPALTANITRMNLLLGSAIIGVMQPLCGIDVPAIIAEIEALGDFDNCDCGCGDGINLSNPTGAVSSGGCCPISVNVIDIDTNNPPVECPGSYFPVTVKDPTASIDIGTANNMSELTGILNAYSAWQAYGVAFAEGNCKVGFFVSNGTTPPNVKVERISITPLPPSRITDNIVTVGTSNPPTGCPSGNPYPKQVYNPGGTLVVGIANNINDLVSILNATGAWSAYGTASVQDNCHVQWNLTDPTVVPPSIPVGNITPACVGGQQFYTLNTLDICNGRASVFTFPVNAYVNFGAGIVPLGYVPDEAAFVAALNATPTKPASVTFSPDTASIGVTIVKNSDCTAFSGTITLYTDALQRNFLVLAANHGSMSPVNTFLGQGEVGIGVRTNSYIGKITFSESAWHNIKIQNTLLITDPYLGKIFLYDITNPLIPVFTKAISLTLIGTTVFTGLPNSVTVASGGAAIASRYSLYFPTDYQTMTLNEVYVVNALWGTIWKLDTTAAPGSEVTGGFQNAQLLGKCPRVIMNNKIWFTQDGDLEQAAGLVSGVAEGSTISLDLATFNAGGIAQQGFSFTNEYLWGATYDGAGHIHYIGNKGTLATLDLSTNALHLYRNTLFAEAFFRLNVRYYNTKLYISALQFNVGAGSAGTMVVDPATRAGTLFGAFTPAGGTVPATSHYNALPLGQSCLIAVTYDGYQNASHPGGGIAFFDSGGNYQGHIEVPAGSLYNIIAFAGISTYSPTSFT